MKNWNELSITDKNDIIKVAVQNGITTLPEIRERYNEFAEGGETNEEYYPIWLDGVTVKPSGNRPTTRDDWNWANWRELENERIQNAAESVRRGIDRNGTPIAAGIFGLAAAPFAIEGLGSSAVANGVRTGLQAMNTAFTPSTWLNPVTGAKLLSPTVGTIADAGIQGTFAYEGLNGLWNQGRQGTLLSDPASTLMHGLEVLPLVGLGSKAIGSTYRNLANSNIVKNKGFALPINNTLYWIGKGLGSEISLAPGTEGYMRVSDVLSKSPGTGRKLYDAAIKYARNNGYNGIESGNMLISAPKTYRMWEHYPNRQLLGNYGSHNNFNMINYGELSNVNNTNDMVANTINSIPTKFEGAPVYGLIEPSQRVFVVNNPFSRIDEVPQTVTKARRTYSTPKAEAMPVEGEIVTGDVPIITAENAASITPAQWTAAQDAAIARGDMAEAQRLRDLHAHVNGYSNGVFAHATPNKFTIFDKSYFGSTTDQGYAGKGFYFSTTRPATQSQIDLGYPIGPHGEYPTMPGYGPNKMYVYIKGNPIFSKYGFPEEKNWFDELDNFGVNGRDFNRTAEITVGNPNHIKSADAVTYDDNGIRIPLGERDNFITPDIRWGLLPWTIGGGAAGYNYLNQDEGPLVGMAMGGRLYDKGGYTVNRGDSLWKIAHDNNMPLSRLRELNPQVKGNMIHPGDVLRLSPELERQIVNLREERQMEDAANMDNFTAIQAAPHDSNYVVVDKPNKKLRVYDRDNNLVYESDGVSFGKSGNDYNTITYVNANGSIRNNAGNNSTPAGISVITGVGTYHGLPSFTRGRINDDGIVENIASSIHYGNTQKKNMSNGCVRANSDTLKELAKYVGEGTAVYTLPEQEGSRFSVKNNKLNYTADNVYGVDFGKSLFKARSRNQYKTEEEYNQAVQREKDSRKEFSERLKTDKRFAELVHGRDFDEFYNSKDYRERYWDDYNVRKDKSYAPLAIVYNGNNYDDEYNANVLSYTNALSINKEALQKKFNLSSDEYNRLAELAVGIAEQESKFGTSIRYKAKQQVPDEAIALAKNFKDSDSTSMFYAAGEALSKTIKGSTAPARSRGLTQIKIGGDNKEMQGIYKELGINENTINNPYTSALATLSRLAYMYNSEVKGRNFNGAGNTEVSPYDALLYKYMGRGSELKNKTATPDKNKYISNVKKYASDFDFLEERLVEKR